VLAEPGLFIFLMPLENGLLAHGDEGRRSMLDFPFPLELILYLGQPLLTPTTPLQFHGQRPRARRQILGNRAAKR